MEFSTIDTVILALYYIVVFAIAYYSSRNRTSSIDYFLAGRHVGWFAIGASIFAANISSEHFIGLAGSGFNSGLAVGSFEVQAPFIILLLGFVFVPFYLRSGVVTMPEFVERRYNSASRWYLTVMSIIAYITTKISVTLFAGAILLKAILGWDVYTSSIVLVVATGLYTILGGMTAVIYTELLQTFVLIAGAVMLTLLGVDRLGGFGELTTSLPAETWSMFKSIDHPDYPWTGIVFGLPILATWYWCTDQFIVQRVLSARNIDHAKAGSIFSGFLKLLPMFIMVLPGIVALALYNKGLLTGIEKPDDAYPVLVKTVLPVGIKGIVIASLLAALMSSLAACFNSGSTLFTFDIYKKIKPGASEKHLVKVGRIATGVLVIFGIMWIPFIEIIGSGQVYVYLQSVQAYVAPPITAIFLLGLIWSRGNGIAAITVLVSGFVLAAFRFVVEVMVKSGSIRHELLVRFASINFLHYCVILFVICIIIFVVVSLLTEKPAQEKLDGLTFRFAANSKNQEAYMVETPIWKRKNLVAGIILLIITIILHIVFL